MTWRLRSVRLFVYGLAAVQVVQAGRHGTDGFQKSYWLIDYDHGFVRRGLEGAVLQTVVGRTTDTSIVVATWVVALLAAAALLVVVELLLRRGTSSSCALAILLVSSPFTIDFVLSQRRPDQLAVPVLVLFGSALVRGRRWVLPASAATGAAFCILTFVHEAILFGGLPFALLLIVVLLDRDRWIPAAMLVVAPAVVGAAVVLAFGGVSASTVAALRADASHIALGKITAFDYLGDTLRTSIDFVAGFPHRIQIASVLLGLGLACVQGWWIVRWVRPRLAGRSAGVSLAVSTAALAGLCAIGVDWVRWFAAVGGALLLVSSFVFVAGTETRDSTSRPDRVKLPRVLPVVAIYLTALAPLPPFVFPKDAVRVLLLKQ